MQQRDIQPELLDLLPANDRRGRQSRRDLLRLNRVMGHLRMAAAALKPLTDQPVPLRLVELGASEGFFLLEVAQRLGRRTPASPIEVVLVDRQNVVAPELEQRFHELNWRLTVVTADAAEFLSRDAQPADIVLCNLFLHHFDDRSLGNFFRLIASKAACFLAWEPRRGSWPLFCTRFLGALGCNSVTRHDARASVSAGFRDDHLTRLWPDEARWEITERPAGLFTHFFCAKKRAL
jgi:hypothetical protein